MEYLFETERLKIRKFRKEDAQALYENHSEEELKKWIPNETFADIDEAAGAIAFYRDRAKDRRLPFVLAVELKGKNELIGDVGINEIEGKDGEVEIGYTISERYSGNGYATEIVRAMTEFAVSAFCIRVLYGRVMNGNSASSRVLEKNGYEFIGKEMGAEDDPYGNGMMIYRKMQCKND